MLQQKQGNKFTDCHSLKLKVRVMGLRFMGQYYDLCGQNSSLGYAS